jgi:hypothetical protein
MSETNSTSFVLETSGYPVSLPNAVYQSSGNLTINYAITGAPASMTIVVEGVASPATSASSGEDYGAQPGSATVLDTYSSTGSVSNRSIALNWVLYDSFRVTAAWTVGTNVTVAGSLQTSGPGPTWNSESLGAVQTYSVG